jgi:hypothetical protein
MPETTITPLYIAAPDGARCNHCTTPGAVNNHIRNYVQGGSYTLLCTRCVNTHYATCRECGERAQHDVCDDCGWMCYSCGVRNPESQERYWYGAESYCDGCQPDPDYDEDDAYTGRPGIRPYSHTHPSRWFGGPLPKDEANKQVGFYLGFELEIGTGLMDGDPIHEWATANNLPEFFDCKEDSSVDGFEIATQPFTPEFFERLVKDGRLESFFEMLNSTYPAGQRGNQENAGHGLHVHIGKVAFARDGVALAAFSYLLGADQGKHLERIARRDPTTYCERVTKPVSMTVVQHKAHGVQRDRLYRGGVFPSRGAINLANRNTVEVRAFRSTRSAEELMSAIRLVYVAAEYVRYLRAASKTRGVDPKLLAWTEFCRWAAFAHPEAFPALAGLDAPKGRVSATEPREGAEWSDLDFEAGAEEERAPYGWVQINPHGCSNRNCCADNFRWADRDESTVRGLAAIDAAPGMTVLPNVRVSQAV